MNYSDSSDSDPETGRFKSLKKKEKNSQYKSYEENVSNYQQRMLAGEKINDNFRRVRILEREECKKSRDSKTKYSEFKERMSDNGHKSTLSIYRHKETLRAETKTNVISSNQDVNRRRSRSIERKCLKLDGEKKRKQKETNIRIKSREKIYTNSPYKTSKNHSSHGLQEKEKSDESKKIGSNEHKGNSKKNHSDHHSCSKSKFKSSNENVSFGPALPPIETDADNIAEHVGPVLPPGFKLNSHHSRLEDVWYESKKQIGPQVPKHILEQIQVQTVDVDMIEHDFDKISSEEEDCNFIIGPIPTGSKTLTATQLELEKRALEIKIKKLDDAETGSTRKIEDEREEWMIELPEIRKVADLGLGARQFRTKERPNFDDRTQWTNTPEVESILKRKEQKNDLQKEQKKLLQTARDLEQDRIANSHKNKNKRDLSLMEIHKKKLKKEKVNNFINIL